jgi:hypothetical protein
MRWHRVDDGTGYRLADARLDVEIFDNGAGVGPSRGSGRWALEVNGRWIANIDTLAEAKERGEAIERGDLDDQGRPYGDVRLPETEEV